MTPSRPYSAVLQLAGLLLISGTVFFQAWWVKQTDFPGILITTLVLMAGYFWVHRPQGSLTYYRWNILVGILLRVGCVFILPWLSDDVYRFIWDGRLIHTGTNPFLYTPEAWLNATEQPGWSSLYPLLNSPQYFSTYPPVAQFTFYLAAWAPAGSSWLVSALGLKLILFAAEIVNLILLKSLLKDDHKVSLYAIHPVIIMEGVGNLHYEVLLVTFLLLFVRTLKSFHFRWSGVWWALAVGTKLTPAMYLPIIYRFLPLKSRRSWLLTALILLGVMFTPMLHPDILSKFATSLDLYFRKFEFNAGFYYLVRQIGLWLSGYNLIQFIGPALGVVTILTILIFTTRQNPKDGRMLIQHLFWLHLTYLLCGTTVHPWYIIVPALWGLLAGWYFPLLWLFLAWLSYSHYHQGIFYERMGWVALEYGLLLLSIWTEWRVKKRGLFFAPESFYLS